MAVWSLCNGICLAHSDTVKINLISELLCIEHGYVRRVYNCNEIDFLTEAYLY